MKLSFLQLPVAAVLLLGGLSMTVAGGPAAFAQGTSTGTVTGTVTDATGAVIPGATITLTDPATNTSRTAVTNKAGQYTMVDVPPANYNISATKSGFATDMIAGQAITVGTQTNANFKMTVGAENTTIEVKASAADLQTLNATVGVTVSPLSIESLPSVARDVSTFASLQPGVTPGGSDAGTVTDQAVYTLDGGNNSSDMDGSMENYTGSFAGNPTGLSSLGGGSSGVMPTPQDSIEEFRVATSGQTADFNNSTGLQAQIVTKRGRNTPHGTAYEYYLDSNIGANTWQNRIPTAALPGGQVKPSYHYNRFGGSLGGPVAPSFMGGRTYLFGNYEGFRYPNAATYERPVPSADLKNGFVTLNVTVNGVATPTRFDLKAADPRGIGIAPVVQQMWNTEEPAGNDPGCTGISGPRCDGVNTIGFKGNVALPQKSDFGVVRLDHDFGDKWHFNTSFRQYAFTTLTSNQVDIGGVLGGKLGTPTAFAPRPQTPWYLVAGLTTNITPTLTNDLHYSYLRNIWYWNSAEAPPQIAGLGGALEPLGEQSVQVLSPYNVSTQQIRERVWDGHDHFFADDATLIKGNHLIQFGGQYQHNFAYHNRTDNGGGINYTTTYQLGDNAGNTGATLPGLLAKGVPATGTTNVRLLSAVLGIVNDSQVAYTRSGDSLTLNPGKTRASDSTTIPYYNMYVTDSWRARKDLTMNIGLGYAIEMPPTEATGKQVIMVDGSGNPLRTLDYLHARAYNATQGVPYNPMIGFALLGNVNGKPKYPYNPFYGGLSPRISLAYNPHFGTDNWLGKLTGDGATVLRAGFGRQFGRLNGVTQVLTPLLGPGLIQAVQCRTALATGVCGSSTPNDSTAFRIGVDGMVAPLPSATPTLPQPNFPGYNSAASAAPQVIDPTFRPNETDNFNLSIQRQINRQMLVEVGYIGRLIFRESNSMLLNTVPYMMSQGGQTFASAYAAVEQAFGCTISSGLCSQNTTYAVSGKTTNGVSTKIYPTVAAQPFFETALSGTGYCAGYTNCTTAVVQKQASLFGNQSVWSLWSALDNGAFNFGRTMQNTPIPGQASGGQGQLTSGVAASIANGYGNYNGGFISFKVNNFHGLTAQTNLTYSKALGINAESQASSSFTDNDVFDLQKNYGVQYYNQKFITNTFVVYQTPWFKSQSGIVGRLLGGYTIAPIFAAGSGQPIGCTTFGSQAFGGADANGFSDQESCIFTNPHVAGTQAHRGIVGGADGYGINVGTSTAGGGAAAVNRFLSPQAVYDSTRPPILGLDNRAGGEGPISGLPYWNMDVSVRKNLRVFERVNLEVSGIMTNVFNHLDFSNGSLSIATPASFGVISSQGNTARQIQMGLRASF